MKKIIGIFSLVILTALLASCGSSNPESANLPTAKILSHEVTALEAMFNINVKNSDIAQAILYEGENVVKMIELAEGANPEVKFSRLVPSTDYVLKIMHETKNLEEVDVITGAANKIAPTAQILNTTVEGGNATIEYELLDPQNAVRNASLRIVKGNEIVEIVDIIPSDSETVTIMGLSANTDYKIVITSDYNLGMESKNNETISESTFKTSEVDKIVTLTEFNIVEEETSSNEKVTAEIILDNPKEAVVNGLTINGVRVDKESFLEESTSTNIKVLVDASWRIVLEAIEYNDGFMDTLVYVRGTETQNYKDVSITFEESTVGETTYKMITNYRELESISQDVTADYMLANDIVYPTGYKTFPIGEQKGEEFTGTFDGAGYTVSGVNFKDNITNVGLFGISNGATFTNVNLEYENLRVFLEGNIIRYGGLVAYAMDSNFDNIELKFEVSVLSYSLSAINIAGGMVGELIGGTVNEVKTENIPSVFREANTQVGGIIGKAENVQITNVSAMVESAATDVRVELGGIVGNITGDYETDSHSSIENANVVIKDILVSAGTFGGVAGLSGTNTTITNANSTIVDIYTKYIGGSMVIGGVSGLSQSKIVNSEGSVYSSKMYAGAESPVNMGGVVGVLQTDIDNASFVASIESSTGYSASIGSTSKVFFMGGIAGQVFDSTITTSIGKTEYTGNSWYLYIGGITGSIKGKNLATISKVEGHVENAIGTAAIDVYAGGTIGVIFEDVEVDDIIGTMTDSRFTTRKLNNATSQSINAGGSVGFNVGTINQAVGSTEGIILEGYKDINYGGVVGNTESSDLSIWENSPVGGKLTNGLALRNGVIVRMHDKTSVKYGIVSGGFAVLPTLLTPTYYLNFLVIADITIDQTNVEDSSALEITEIEIVIEDETGAKLPTSQKAIASISELDWTNWDMTGETPIIPEIEALRGA